MAKAQEIEKSRAEWHSHSAPRILSQEYCEQSNQSRNSHSHYGHTATAAHRPVIGPPTRAAHRMRGWGSVSAHGHTSHRSAASVSATHVASASRTSAHMASASGSSTHVASTSGTSAAAASSAATTGTWHIHSSLSLFLLVKHRLLNKR